MTTRGFSGVRCPYCGEADTIRVNVVDVATMHCSGCDGDLTVDEVKEVVKAWERLLAWLNTAPPRGE